MGMLRNGRWMDRDAVHVGGAYRRENSRLQGAATQNGTATLQREPGRFRLIVSESCPWSHRTTIVRAIKGLGARLPIHIVHGQRVEGYPLDDGRAWTVPGTVRQIRHLHELYALHDPAYTGRATVPVLWDSECRTIVSNDSADIVRALDAIETDFDFTLRPEAIAVEIDDANARLHDGLNNAVYRAGFARGQTDYEEAAEAVFDTLDALEQRLSSSRYCFGTTLTETDIRLFATLVRFDAIYVVLFKCCRRRLVDYPHLWAYARDLFQWPGIAATVNFDTMRRASYLADSRDPFPIVALAPEMDWSAPHERATLGDAQIVRRDGGLRPFMPDRAEAIS